MRYWSRRGLIPLALLAAAPVWAQEHRHGGPLTVRHPWARPTVDGQTVGAAYATLANAGAASDRLLAARTEAARAVELHAHTITPDGVARMRPVAAIEIPAGGETSLAPGGLHIMLIGLAEPLREGATFPLTLTFEGAGELTVEVRVERPRAGDTAAPTAPATHGH